MKLQALMMSALLAVPVITMSDEPPPPIGVWTGKGQAGYVASQGNTDSKSANAMLDMGFIAPPWKHAFHLEGLYGQSAGITAAERWDTQWQSNYSITPKLFGFGALRYDHDLFSGFQYQGSVAGGAGYQIFDSDATKLSVQLGAGYRSLRPERLIKNASGAVVARILEPRGSGAIGTAGADFAQTLSSTTTLTDKLLVEAGSLNTLVTDALALTVKVTTKLALSVGYSLQDNSKPPAGLKKLDSIETVNLVFGF